MGAVTLKIDGPLAWITLNRSEKLNTIDLALCRDLEAAVHKVAAEDDVRVVLVRGAGRTFCAGIDRDMLAREGMPPDFFESHERAFCELELMDKITVAVLHGYCLGGGLQLAISCDIRVASTDCQMGLPAVADGLIPGMATFRLPRLIGAGPARRLILSGETLGPAEALRLGLVDHVVPSEDFDAGVAAVLEIYLAAPRTAAAASKRLMARAFDAPLETVYEEALPLLRDCLASPELAAASERWRRRRVLGTSELSSP
jgi:enoyl-CoA hydratase/carnithine racemase